MMEGRSRFYRHFASRSDTLILGSLVEEHAYGSDRCN